MFRLYIKNIRISVIVTIFLLGSVAGSYASLNMDEVKAEFLKETGQKWNEVKNEERKKYLHKSDGRKKKDGVKSEKRKKYFHKSDRRKEIKERKKRVEGIKLPFHIKEGFERKNNKKWETATLKEQQKFIKKYQKSWVHAQRKESSRIRKKQRAKVKVQKEREKKKRIISKRKVKRVREAEKKVRQKTKKKRQTQKRLQKKGKRSVVRGKIRTANSGRTR